MKHLSRLWEVLVFCLFFCYIFFAFLPLFTHSEAILKLLRIRIGGELSSLINESTTDDDPPRTRRRGDEPRPSSPMILWAAELPNGTKLVIVDERQRRMIEVRSFMDRTEVLGSVKIAERLVALGILREESAEARGALPREISDEFPLAASNHASRDKSARKGGAVQLKLGFAS